jgi:hypothetical protein
MIGDKFQIEQYTFGQSVTKKGNIDFSDQRTDFQHCFANSQHPISEEMLVRLSFYLTGFLMLEFSQSFRQATCLFQYTPLD